MEPHLNPVGKNSYVPIQQCSPLSPLTTAYASSPSYMRSISFGLRLLARALVLYIGVH